MNLLLKKGGSAADMLNPKTQLIARNKRAIFMSVRVATLEPLSAQGSPSPSPSPQRSVSEGGFTNSVDAPESESTVQRAGPANRTQIGFGPQAQRHSHREPLIDSEVPGVIRVTAARHVAVSGVTFAKLDPLPRSVQDPQFNTLLKQKLDICCEILDFLSPNAQVQEKEIKSRSLCELIELFENSREVTTLNDEQKGWIFHMLEMNILRQDPIYPIVFMSVDYSLSIVEPAWPHLFYCYQILNRFIQLFPDSHFLGLDTVKKLIHLTQLPDTNERMQLIAFLRTYFDKNEKSRVEVLKMVERKLIDIRDGSATPFCAMPLLILLTHIYHKMANTVEYKRTLNEAVLPLLGLRFLPMYHQNLKQLLVSITEKNSGFVHSVLRKLELMWPHTSGTKQKEFLEILIALCSKSPQDIFRPLARRVFKFIGECILSPNVKVSEVSIGIWAQVTPNNWIGLNSRLAIQGTFDNIMFIIQKSIYPTSVEKAKLALTEMSKINKSAYHKINTLYKQKMAQRYRTRVPNDCQRAWVSVAKAARENFGDFDMHAKLKEFQETFHNETQRTLAMSHFIPVLKKDIDKSIEDCAKTPLHGS